MQRAPREVCSAACCCRASLTSGLAGLPVLHVHGGCLKNYSFIIKILYIPSFIGSFCLIKVVGVSPDNLFLNHVLKLCVLVGQVAVAADTLSGWYHVADVISCNTLLKGFAKEVDLPNAEAMLRRMLSKGPAPNLITFNTMINCAVLSFQTLGARAHRGSSPAAAQRPWELLDQLIELGLKPDRCTCSTIAKGMHLVGCSSVEIDRAIVLLQRIGPDALQKPGVDSQESNARSLEVLFNTLLDVCISASEHGRLAEVFKMMKEFRISSSSVTFGTLIKAFGKAGHVQQCREVWEGMHVSQIEPTVTTFGCYIEALILNNHIAEAERIFESMTESAVLPNAVVYA